MCASCIDVENEWVSLDIGIKNIIICLIFRYRFPNFPLCLFGPLQFLGSLDFRKNSLSPTIKNSCLLGTDAYAISTVINLRGEINMFIISVDIIRIWLKLSKIWPTIWSILPENLIKIRPFLTKIWPKYNFVLLWPLPYRAKLFRAKYSSLNEKFVTFARRKVSPCESKSVSSWSRNEPKREKRVQIFIMFGAKFRHFRKIHHFRPTKFRPVGKSKFI